MKPETILYAINDIESEFLMEARAESVPQHHRSRRFAILIAAVIALMVIAVTAFASEEVAGWFRLYFAKQSDTPLTPEQIQFIDAHEQIFGESQTHDGYTLELKSILSDTGTVYVTIGITAPAGVTEEDLRCLWGSDIDFFDENGKPAASWGVKLHVGVDGKENSADLVFEVNPADWNSGTLWTLRIKSLSKLVHNKAYEQELLETKYAGQDDIMFTDEESAKIHQQILLAEGPWEFVIDLSNIQTDTLELITEPIAVQVLCDYQEDGTKLFDEVQITSFILSPLTATIQTDADYPPNFTINDRTIYVVMDDGSRIALLSNWGVGGKQHFNAESPIMLEKVDHVLLANDTKIMAP